MFTRLLRVFTFRAASSLPVYILVAAVSFFAFQVLRDSTAGDSPAVSAASVEKGKALAGVYCQSCHVLPDPAWLDSKTWEHGVMPAMGPRVGIFKHRGIDYPNLRHDPGVEPAFYPTQPWLDADQWQNIIDYYVASAPAALPAQSRTHPIELSLTQFAVESPPSTYREAATSFVRIIEDGPLRGLVVSDVLRQQTFLLNHDLIQVDAIQTPGSIVDLQVDGGAMLACNIGEMSPNTGRSGKAQRLRFDSGNLTVDPLSVFEDLRRPVQIGRADLNNDGAQDYLVCEFGYLTGGLSWMEGLGGGMFRRHELSAAPGPIKFYLDDHNGDGRMDFWVLFTQGDEGVVRFTNKGGGVFNQETMLRFPSVYGSSYFELVDFNEDGHPDILHACGDNGDFTNILKPYHGVYVYLNDSSDRFEQKYFFPINGCNKAIARDFDGDGDVDIAATSYFADYANQPEEGFVYLKSLGGLDFRPQSLEDGKRGRWLTMDAGDIDGDGDIDLVLGNCSMLHTVSRSTYNWTAEPQLLLLRNVAKASD